MGTRTYSRRGVLTAAGRRRAGLEAIDILGNALQQATDVSPFVFNAYDLNNFESNEIIADNIERVQKSDEPSLIAYLQKQQQLPPSERNLSDIMNLVNYAVYPDVRLQAIQMAVNTQSFFSETDQSEAAKISRKYNPQSNMIEYMYAISQNDEDFIERFWTGFALLMQSPNSWAITKEYMSHIGPNKERKFSRDEFDYSLDRLRYMKQLQLSPKIIDALEKSYQKTQRLLAEKGYPEDGVTLYRGTSTTKGMAVESWTDLKKVANWFKRYHRQGAELREEKIPRKFIIGSWDTIPGWKEDVEPYVNGKQEYMVLGASFYDQK